MTGSAQVQMAQARSQNILKLDVKDVKVVKLGREAVDLDRLTKPRALALQQELLNTFTAPKFQKKLNEIARKHSTERNSAYTSFRQLVRKSQREIIPRYGFDASEEGVECMMKAFRKLKDDPDIYVNECAIKEALSLDYGQFQSQSHDLESVQMSLMRQTLSELSELSETPLLPRSAVQSGSVRNLVILWLRRLIIRFSTPTFQAYRSLKGFHLNDCTGRKGQTSTSKEQLAKVEVEGVQGVEGVRDCDLSEAVHRHLPHPEAHDTVGDIDGYCQLLAWADGKSGVEGVRQVRMMIKEACILDEEVAQLFNTMNMTLGLRPKVERCCNVTVLDSRKNSSIGSLHLCSFCSFCSRLDLVWKHFARITKSIATKQACFAQWTQETWHGSWCLQAISCFFALAFDSGVASLWTVQAKQKGLKKGLKCWEIQKDPSHSRTLHFFFKPWAFCRVYGFRRILPDTTWSWGLEPYCQFRSILLFLWQISDDWMERYRKHNLRAILEWHSLERDCNFIASIGNLRSLVSLWFLSAEVPKLRSFHGGELTPSQSHAAFVLSRSL